MNFGRLIFSGLLKGEEDEEKVKRLRSALDYIGSTGGVNNILRMLKIRLTDADAVEKFDRNPDILVCLNGVVELETGQLRPGRPDDYMTKSLQV